MDLPNRPIKDPYQELPIKDFSYVNTQNHPAKKSKQNIVWIIVGIAALLVLGSGAFLYGHYTKPKPKVVKQTHKVVASKSTYNSSAPTTNYTSTAFGLTVTYPNNWAVSSIGNTSITITSPETTLTSDIGSSVMGRILVNILGQGQVPAGFGAGSVAVLDSQVVAFANPTASQAAQTYISFVQYPATTVKGGLDAIYVTGNNGYQKDGPIPTSDVNKISPLIFVSFQQCKDIQCSEVKTLTIASTMWSNTNFSNTILNIIKSFTFS